MRTRIAITIVGNQLPVELAQAGPSSYIVQWGTAMLATPERDYALETFRGWVTLAINNEAKAN